MEGYEKWEPRLAKMSDPSGFPTKEGVEVEVEALDGAREVFEALVGIGGLEYWGALVVE